MHLFSKLRKEIDEKINPLVLPKNIKSWIIDQINIEFTHESILNMVLNYKPQDVLSIIRDVTDSIIREAYSDYNYLKVKSEKFHKLCEQYSIVPIIIDDYYLNVVRYRIDIPDSNGAFAKISIFHDDQYDFNIMWTSKENPLTINFSEEQLETILSNYSKNHKNLKKSLIDMISLERWLEKNKTGCLVKFHTGEQQKGFVVELVVGNKIVEISICLDLLSLNDSSFYGNVIDGVPYYNVVITFTDDIFDKTLQKIADDLTSYVNNNSTNKYNYGANMTSNIIRKQFSVLFNYLKTPKKYF